MRVGIGILGGGTVGGTLARKLIEDTAVIAAKSGITFDLVGVAVRDASKTRPFASGFATTDPESLIDDERVQVVVEVMGGIEPARALVLRALRAGKAVVTANKELIAAHGPELFAAAEEAAVSILFEAAVGGGIPVIRPLSESLAGEPLTSILGIVNGTTNFILSAMAEEARAYDDVLAEAQALGYAEADPTADVGGGDAAAKAAILAGLGFGVWVGSDRVHTEGIHGIDVNDLAAARDLGYTVKLLGIADSTEHGVCVRVHPTLVPLDHPLSAIRGANNAVFVEGPAVGELLFSGPGAGGDPTATAVLGDVIVASRELLAGTPVAPRIRFGDGQVVDFATVMTQWFVRLEVIDAPGVLARIASCFGDHDVSIMSLRQEGRGDDATLLIVTHDALEENHRRAMGALEELDVVRQVAATFRVISSEH